MAFDLEKFRRTRYEDRTAELRFHDLAPLFESMDDPVFRVRGLTGIELARVNEAASSIRQEQQQAVLALLAGAARRLTGEDLGEALFAMLGVSEEEDAPCALHARTLATLRYGLIEPRFAHEDAVRFAHRFPAHTMALVNRINELTAMGAALGKPSSSTPTPASEQA